MVAALENEGLHGREAVTKIVTTRLPAQAPRNF